MHPTLIVSWRCGYNATRVKRLTTQPWPPLELKVAHCEVNFGQVRSSWTSEYLMWPHRCFQKEISLHNGSQNPHSFLTCYQQLYHRLSPSENCDWRIRLAHKVLAEIFDNQRLQMSFALFSCCLIGSQLRHHQGNSHKCANWNRGVRRKPNVAGLAIQVQVYSDCSRTRTDLCVHSAYLECAILLWWRARALITSSLSWYFKLSDQHESDVSLSTPTFPQLKNTHPCRKDCDSAVK